MNILIFCKIQTLKNCIILLCLIRWPTSVTASNETSRQVTKPHDK